MKLWITSVYNDSNDSFDIIGVFDNEDKAKKAAERAEKNGNSGGKEWHGDGPCYSHVGEYALNEYMPIDVVYYDKEFQDNMNKVKDGINNVL